MDLFDLLRRSFSSLDKISGGNNGSQHITPEQIPDFDIPRRSVGKSHLSASKEIMHHLETNKDGNYIDFIKYEIKYGSNSTTRLKELCEVWQDID